MPGLQKDTVGLDIEPGYVAAVQGTPGRVVVVAARRDMIDRLVQAARSAGLNPQGIDLSAFAMIRALHRADATGPVAYVNVGGLTNLAIATGRTCVFTRVVSTGIASLAG